MTQQIVQTRKKSHKPIGKNFPITIFLSLTALIATFAISNFSTGFINKLLVFCGIILVYLILLIIVFYFFKPEKIFFNEINSDKEIFNDEVVEKLMVLEEANRFFGASLKSADMFRLVASRISDLIEYDTCALFLINGQEKIAGEFAVGRNSGNFDQVKLNLNEGLAGKAFDSRKAEIDANLQIEAEVLPKEFLENLKSAVAVPLIRGGEIYGFLNLYSGSKDFFDENRRILLEAIAVRIAPLINSSLMFEKGISNAMTDLLTNLPNERAFYMVLENQIAEAQRFQAQRSLTVLAIDLKDFDEINQKYGHSTGDKILSYTAEQIKQQLRRMDFVSRTFSDEFLIVLPTATDQFTENIIRRLKKLFADKPFKIAEDQPYAINLCFGSSTFGSDGETAEELIKIAKLRKTQSKGKNNQVIFFPKQYVN